MKSPDRLRLSDGLTAVRRKFHRASRSSSEDEKPVSKRHPSGLVSTLCHFVSHSIAKPCFAAAINLIDPLVTRYVQKTRARHKDCSLFVVILTFCSVRLSTSLRFTDDARGLAEKDIYKM